MSRLRTEAKIALVCGVLGVALTALAALLPPGTPGGTPARVTCTVYRPDAGAYARLAGPGSILPDGGIVLADYPDAVVFREDLCAAVAGDGGALATVTPECACSSGTGCAAPAHYLDGGSAWLAAPLGVTLGPGQFDGGGCVAKVCGVLAGMQEAWPTGCPSQ